MQLLLTRRSGAVCLVLAALLGMIAAPGYPIPVNHPRLPAIVAAVGGTISGLDTTAGTVQVTDRKGAAITLTVNSATVIRLDGKTATLADLKTDDLVVAIYNPTTKVATRIVATSPPPTDLAGTITALDAAGGTFQVTTDHGTVATLTVNSDTKIRLNGAATTFPNLAAGELAVVTYRAADRIARTLLATTPPVNTVSGAITALDLTGGTLQVTPLVGGAKSVKLNADTDFRLNGRRVVPSGVTVGYLATVRFNNDGTATVVNAETPQLVDLEGTISAIDLAGSTFQVTTVSATAITLKLTSTTAIQRDGAAATADKLVMGDQVVVRYEYLLIPGTSPALRIVAKSAALPPVPALTVTALTLNPTSVKGGGVTMGTVTISAAAPSTGATVTLLSSNTAAAVVPANVLVPSGQTTATFPVITAAVAANTSVNISASLGGTTSVAGLTVTP
jgi:hypothetical protein